MIHKKIVIALLCLTSAAGAQTITKAGLATQFNQWRSYGSVNLIAGANANVTVSPCQVQGGGPTQFSPFTASTPIKIVDPNNPSIDETITPTSVVSCTATLTTTNAHPTPWYIISGSGGLGEAINNTAQSGLLNSVIIDAPWHANGFGASTIYALVAGSTSITLEDATINPKATYRWSGTHYVPSLALFGVASPTPAAGAAAGTAPTISNNAGSSGNLMTLNLTTGTATTTGTLFTETVATAPPLSGNMNCVLQNVGANVPPAISISSALGVLTATVAVAPPISTPYIINLTCN
jgi:hypothetical protein